MRAQCCICADLFENSQAVNIAAVPCGHVFHEACLMRWMNNSSTCPSCRTHIKKNQIIKRLFFDICEDEGKDEDVSHFVNQVSDLKAQLRENQKATRDVEESRDKLAALLAVAESKQEELTTKLSRELSMKDVLKGDLRRVQRENDCHVQEIGELQKKAEKLQGLQRVETILKGSSSDAEEMLRQYADGGDSAIRQLASLVTVMKREYNQAVADKRAAKEHLSKVKQHVGTVQAEAKRARREIQHLRLELEATNTSLSQKEKENDENRRKIVHLRNALRHNKTKGSQSFHAALSEDSPNVAYSPVDRQSPTDTPHTDGDDVDQENCVNLPAVQKPCRSPDLFDVTPKKPPKMDVKSTDEEQCPGRYQAAKRFRLADEKINGEKDTVKNLRQPHQTAEEEDEPHIPPAMMSILQKKLTGRSNSHSHVSGSVITRGFDGFGGSTTFVHPQGHPRGSLLKLGQQRKKPSSSGVRKNANIQRLQMPKSQPQIKDCISSKSASAGAESAPLLISAPASSSSSSSSLPSVKKSSSSTLGLFISKGPSLSKKVSSAPTSNVIDLTDL